VLRETVNRGKAAASPEGGWRQNGRKRGVLTIEQHLNGAVGMVVEALGVVTFTNLQRQARYA
jgi:hypothetical protein